MNQLQTDQKGIFRVQPVDGATPPVQRSATNVTAFADNNNILVVGAIDPGAPLDIPVSAGVSGTTNLNVQGTNELGVGISQSFPFTVVAAPTDPAITFIGQLINVGPK